MGDMPRSHLAATDKGQASHYLQSGHLCLQVILQSDTVLDEHDSGVAVHDGCQHILQQVIVDGLQSHQYHIGHRHLPRIAIGLHPVEMETAVAGVYL